MIAVLAASIFAVFASATEVKLYWPDAYENEAGYYVERAEGREEFEQLGRTIDGATEYIDTDVETGVTYRYRVQAYNYFQKGPYTNVVRHTIVEGKYFEELKPIQGEAFVLNSTQSND